jgi:hypothetical protein
MVNVAAGLIGLGIPCFDIRKTLDRISGYRQDSTITGHKIP